MTETADVLVETFSFEVAANSVTNLTLQLKTAGPVFGFISAADLTEEANEMGFVLDSATRVLSFSGVSGVLYLRKLDEDVETVCLIGDSTLPATDVN